MPSGSPYAGRIPLAQACDDALRRAPGHQGAGGDADAALAFDPATLDVVGTADQMRNDALFLPQFAQAVGVVRRADDEHRFALGPRVRTAS
jgi:hypothetical protein